MKAGENMMFSPAFVFCERAAASSLPAANWPRARNGMYPKLCRVR